MKYILSIVLISIVSFTYFACRKSEQVGPKVYLINSEKKLTSLTRATQSFGIRELDQVDYTPHSVTYAFTGGTFTYNQLAENKMQLVLRKGTKKVTLTCNKVTMIYEEKGQDLLAQPSPRERTADESLPIDDQTDIATAIALYNELTNIELERVPIFIDDRLICKKTAVSIRLTKSASIDHLNTFVNGYLETHLNCSKLHGVDSGCMWGDYGCVSTQQLQCNC